MASADPLRRVLALLAPILVAALVAATASAQEPGAIRLRVDVVHVSNEPGGIDPKGQELHRYLSPQVRYESMKVLDSRELRLKVDEVGEVRLPNGREVRMRPLDVTDRGVLIAVDVEGQAQMDLRVKRRHKAFIGAHPYQGGKLVIGIEPDF